MNRVLVIGCPGSGKSTFSRALAEKTGLPLIHLDQLYWNADRTTVEKQVFRRRLQDALEGESWIIDGDYASTMELRLQRCDTVFFLDYPEEVCLSGVRDRVGKLRADLPWTETGVDEELIGVVRNYRRDKRPVVLDLLQRYADKEIHVFTSRREAAAFLEI